MDAREIEISKLDGRAANPRRRLGDIAGLATSIKHYGVLEPLVVRPKGKRFEVVAGHRRLAAAKTARLKVVPCVVREFDDLDVGGAALAENIQREGLEPIDEGDAIDALLEQGWSLEDVAAKIGRSPSYVAKRRQLAALHPKARAAVIKGEVSLGVALQVARLPKAQHPEAMELLVGHTEESARSMIERTFLLRLADASFSRTDANLAPKAGACTKCPKRTGAQPALFDDVKGKDVCTDRACYEAKGAAAWRRRADDHRASGGAVLEDADDVRKVLGYSDRPSYASGYVDTLELVSGPKGEATVSHMALAAGLAPPVTLARAPSGRVIEMYRRKDVADIVKVAAPAELPTNVTDLRAVRAEAGRARATTATMLQALAPRLAADGVEMAGWRTLLTLAVEELAYSSLDDARIEQLSHIAAAGSLYEIQGGLAEVLLSYAAERRKGEVHPALERFGEIHGVTAPEPEVVADAG